MLNRLILDNAADGTLRVSFRRAGQEFDEASGIVPGFASPFSADDLEDLRWYLEEYLTIPFAVYEERGRTIQAKLGPWGQALFGAVFGPGQPGRDAYVKARDGGACELVLRSGSTPFFSLPWELLQDPERPQPVALELHAIDRTVDAAGAASAVPPGPDLRVLMVIARPHGRDDVGYQMIARPLLERLEAVSGRVTLDVLRPPTLDALVERLGEATASGQPYHILHFDGHGTFGAGAVPAGANPQIYDAGGLRGFLVFEQEGGGSDLVDAGRFALEVNRAQVPLVVLNACRSGMVGEATVEAAVATQLLKGGAASVVAMGYSVYAVAAAEFMTAFYEALFGGRRVSDAVAEGRRRLYRHRDRPSQKGLLPLEDWIVPVHYLRRTVGFAALQRQAPAPGRLPLDAFLDASRPGGGASAGPGADPLAPDRRFIGRDAAFYALELVLRAQRVVLVHGPAGTGKTELAKAFGRWWQATGGVDRPDWVFFHGFEPGVASFGLDGAITQIGLTLFGPDFIGRTQHADHRHDIILDAMRQYTMLLIWDNVETLHDLPDPTGATKPLDEAEQRRMRDFLTAARAGKSGVILTSRTEETWLGDIRRIALGGLSPSEAAELAEDVLRSFPAARLKRGERDFAALMAWLDGHPLSLRLVLPQLEAYSAATLLQALKGSAQALPPGFVGEGRLASLGASLQYSFDHFAPELRERARALALFEGAVDEDVLAAFSRMDGAPTPFVGVTKEEWSALLQRLAAIGVLTEIGAGMYGLHPALPSYLMAEWRRAAGANFLAEHEAADRALLMAYANFGAWLLQQIGGGSTETALALIDRQRRTMGRLLGSALAQKHYDLAQAILEPLNEFWDTRGLTLEADGRADRCLEALEDASGAPPEAAGDAGALWRFVIGSVAIRAYRAGRLDDAERAYNTVQRQMEAANDPAYRSVLGVVYHQLGIVAEHRGNLLAAEKWNRQSLTIKEALSDRPGVAGSYHQLGIVAQRRGDLPAAEKWYRQSLTIWEAVGDRPGLARCYHHLGIVAQLRGDLRAAENWYCQSLAISEPLGHRSGMARGYHQLGMVAQVRGDLPAAESWYRQSLSIKEALSDRPGMATTYHQLGIVAQDRGDLPAAENWYRQSLAIKDALDDRPGMAMSYGQMGSLCETRGDRPAALDWVIRCVALFPDFPDPQTGPGPEFLAQLTAELGMPAMEEGWLRCTGALLPDHVRASLAQMIAALPPDPPPQAT